MILYIQIYEINNMHNKSIIYFAFLFLYLAKPFDSEELLKELLEEVSRLFWEEFS